MEGEGHVCLCGGPGNGEDVVAVDNLGVPIRPQEAGLGRVGKDGLILPGLSAIEAEEYLSCRARHQGGGAYVEEDRRPLGKIEGRGYEQLIACAVDAVDSELHIVAAGNIGEFPVEIVQSPSVRFVGKKTAVVVEQGDGGAVDSAPGRQAVNGLDDPVLGYPTVEIGFKEIVFATGNGVRVDLDVVDRDPPLPVGFEVPDAELDIVLACGNLGEVDMQAAVESIAIAFLGSEVLVF